MQDVRMKTRDTGWIHVIKNYLCKAQVIQTICSLLPFGWEGGERYERRERGREKKRGEII